MKNRTAKILILLLAFLFVSPLTSLAAVQVVEKTGSIFAGDPYYNAEKNAYTVDFSGTDVATIVLQSYSAGFGEMIIEKTINAADDGYSYMVGNNFTCNMAYKTYYKNSAGQQVGYLAVVISGIVSPTCDSGAAGEMPTEGEKCDSCAVFECPAWGDYMGKLDDIQAAIPPPPNWPVVADIFRDSIAPRIKEDMADLIGTTGAPSTPSLPSAPKGSAPTGSAPSAPSAPSTGTAPDKPSALDDGGIQAPTGQEAPGLGDSTFSPDDVKSAPEIEFKEDPTGGFTLDNPIGGLPSQEEFKENTPVEGEAALPNMPGYDPSIPAPSAGEYDPSNPAPNAGSYDPSNPAPSAGEYDASNPAPVNGEYDPSNPAPSSGGGSNEDFSPKAGNYESTPMPSGTAPTAPTPTAPAPVSGTAPIPGTPGGTAPIPGNDGSAAPIPGG